MVSNELLQVLLEACKEASENAEVPVASLIFPTKPCADTLFVCLARNSILEKKDPTAHSEIEAIRRAARIIGNERLSGYSLLTALEPCLMCSGAIIHARLDAVYYLSPSDKGPGLRWVLGLTRNTPMRTNHYPELIRLHDYSREYQELLRSFFEKKR